ncbi:MAG: rhomboid family intramembrane serine protease [Candidatus Rokubacteria bacterium]|nr:rhomboid family intramembrane serine protease [Candidatus Rokubacteria bacterium]
MTVVLLIIVVNVVVSLFGFRALSAGDQKAQAFVFVPYQVARGENGLGMLLAHFAHLSYLHLGFNMFALYSFSATVLNGVGSARYLAIYAAAGLGSDLVVFALRKDDPTYRCLGASGSVFGIMMAAVVLDPTTSIAFVFVPIPIPGPVFMLGYGIISIFLITKNKRGGVSHEGHLGGAIIGFAVAILLAPRGLQPLHRWLAHWF